MKNMTWDQRTKPDKRGIAKRIGLLFLLLGSGLLLGFSGAGGMVLCFFWGSGLLAFFILLAGMNEDVDRGAYAGNRAAPAAGKGRRPVLLSPSFND